MKGFLKSKRFLALVTLVILVASFAIPLARNSHAQAAPTIILSPTSGPPGTVVTVTGSGWTPGRLIDIRFGTSGPSIVTPTVASDGTFSTTITIPSNAAFGPLTISGDQAGVTALATFTVTSPTPTPPPSVSFTKAATKTVAPGGTVDYILTLKNTSPAGTLPLHDIHITDLLPSGLTAITKGPTFTITPPTGSGFGSCTKSGLSVSCTVDNFAPGAVVTIKFSASVSKTATGTITNTATAHSTVVSAKASDSTKITPSPTHITIETITFCAADVLTGFLGGDVVIKFAGHQFKVIETLLKAHSGLLIVKDIKTNETQALGADLSPHGECLDIALVLYPPDVRDALKKQIDPLREQLGDVVRNILCLSVSLFSNEPTEDICKSFGVTE